MKILMILCSFCQPPKFKGVAPKFKRSTPRGTPKFKGKSPGEPLQVQGVTPWGTPSSGGAPQVQEYPWGAPQISGGTPSGTTPPKFTEVSQMASPSSRGHPQVQGGTPKFKGVPPGAPLQFRGVPPSSGGYPWAHPTPPSSGGIPGGDTPQVQGYPRVPSQVKGGTPGGAAPVSSQTGNSTFRHTTVCGR